jgi:hypothetical protein
MVIAVKKEGAIVGKLIHYRPKNSVFSAFSDDATRSSGVIEDEFVI